MEKVKKKPGQEYSRPALIIVLICLFFSLASLGIYLDESGYPDGVLFSLLMVLRYSSFLMCISSVYLLVNCTVQIIRKPSILMAIMAVLSFFCALFGASMVIVEAFIFTIAGGIE